jgi:hypothetical protein
LFRLTVRRYNNAFYPVLFGKFIDRGSLMSIQCRIGAQLDLSAVVISLVLLGIWGSFVVLIVMGDLRPKIGEFAFGNPWLGLLMFFAGVGWLAFILWLGRYMALREAPELEQYLCDRLGAKRTPAATGGDRSPRLEPHG